MNKIFNSMTDAETWFTELFGDGESFDATARTLHLWDVKSLILYINGLVDGDTITALLTEMQWGSEEMEKERNGAERFLSFFPYHAVAEAQDKREY